MVLVNWDGVSLLRASPCEWVIASDETTALKFSSENFVKSCGLLSLLEKVSLQ